MLNEAITDKAPSDLEKNINNDTAKIVAKLKIDNRIGKVEKKWRKSKL